MCSLQFRDTRREIERYSGGSQANAAGCPCRCESYRCTLILLGKTVLRRLHMSVRGYYNQKKAGECRIDHTTERKTKVIWPLRNRDLVGFQRSTQYVRRRFEVCHGTGSRQPQDRCSWIVHEERHSDRRYQAHQGSITRVHTTRPCHRRAPDNIIYTFPAATMPGSNFKCGR